MRSNDEINPQKCTSTVTLFTVTFWQAHLLSLALCVPQYSCGALVQLQDSRDDQRVHANMQSTCRSQWYADSRRTLNCSSVFQLEFNSSWILLCNPSVTPKNKRLYKSYLSCQLVVCVVYNQIESTRGATGGFNRFPCMSNISRHYRYYLRCV